MKNEVMFWLISGLLAISAGSFTNVLVYRLPQQIYHPDTAPGLFLPRSHCPDCKTTILLRDLIPIISWLWLKAHCRHCNKMISWRYPGTELTMLLGGLALSWLFQQHIVTLLLALLFSWMLLTLTLIDNDHQLLPDALTQPLLCSGLLSAALLLNPRTGSTSAILGATGGWLFFSMLAGVGKYVCGKEVLGQGDVKLLVALGAWLGYSSLPLLLLLASAGALLAVGVRHFIWHIPLSQPLALGPWLALAGEMLFIRQQI